MNNEATSKAIKALRESAGLSQSQISEATGHAVARFSEWENGRRSIGLDLFINLCATVAIEPAAIIQTVFPKLKFSDK